MDVKPLLKKKLQLDVSYPYKIDRNTGNYYRTDQVRLEFPIGTSCDVMKAWVDYYVQVARSQNIEVRYSAAYYSNGNCIVTGNNMSIFSMTSGGGTSVPPPPPPKPVIFPESYNLIHESLVSIKGRLQLIAVSEFGLATIHSEPLI